MKVGLADDAINIGFKKGFKKGEKEGFKKGEKEGFKKGIEKGREEGKIEIIQSMLLNEISPKTIAEWTNIDLKFIESIL